MEYQVIQNSEIPKTELSPSKVLVIIQARMDSKRLPNKILAKIDDTEMILKQIARVKLCDLVDQLVVATTDSASDDEFVKLLESNCIQYFRGETQNVLSRFVAIAKKELPTHVVRITADCPLIDPNVIASVIRSCVQGRKNYVSTDNSFPDGFDVEVFDYENLLIAGENATESYDLEHVTPYIKRTVAAIEYLSLSPSKEHLRVTVDEPVDLEVVRTVFEFFAPNVNFSMQEVIQLLEATPELSRLNSHIVRNEGAMLSSGQKLWRRALNVIPTGNHLLSKNSDQFLPNEWPSYFERAKGCEIWDLDSNHYFDVSLMGVGTNTLGYGDDYVDSKVQEAIKSGNMSTLNCKEEVLLAEQLIKLHPHFEMVRFTRTGGEANAVAVRLARAATGKDKVAVCGYHGWHDWYLAGNIADESGLTSHLLPGLETRGVPNALRDSTTTFHYGNAEEFQKIIRDGDVGAVIMEFTRSSTPDINFLQMVRTETQARGIILIFDECSSGFRDSFGAMHTNYSIFPDMIMLGKALGNGYAINAVLGTRNIMQEAERTFMSSTFWTERIGNVAGLATLEVMDEMKSWEIISRTGKTVQENWEKIATSSNVPIQINGYPAISSFTFRDPEHLKLKTYLTQQMLKRGFLANTMFYASIAHTEEILASYLSNLEEVFQDIGTYLENDRKPEILQGPICKSGFGRLN